MDQLKDLKIEETTIEQEKVREENSKKNITVEKGNLIDLFNKLSEVMISKNEMEHLATEESLVRIKDNWKLPCYLSDRWNKNDWGCPINRCAYAKRYGAHVAGLVLDLVYEAVSKCPDLVSTFQKSPLKVVSMGGGPGNDVAGLCSALKTIIEFSGKVEIVIGDSVFEWEEIAFELFEMLRKDYGNCSEMFRLELKEFSYFSVTFPDSLIPENEFYDSLREADLVLMVRVISVMDTLDEKRDTIKKLHSAMKDGAVVLLIDTAFKTDDLFSAWFSDFETVYRQPRKDYSFADVTSDITMGVFRKKKIINA